MGRLVFVSPREDPDAFIRVISLGNSDDDMRLCACMYVGKKEANEVRRIMKKGNERGEMKAEN